MLVCGCRNASVRSRAARVAILVHDKPDMLNCFGENFTVSHTRVAAFLTRRFSSTFNGVVLVHCTIQVCHVSPSCCAYIVVQSLQLFFPVGLMV